MELNLRGSPKQIRWANSIIGRWEELWVSQRDSRFCGPLVTPQIVKDVEERLPHLLAVRELQGRALDDFPSAVLARAKVIRSQLRLTREDVDFALPALLRAYPEAGWYCNNHKKRLAEVVALGLVEAILSSGGWTAGTS